MTLYCVECGDGNAHRNWFEVADGRWLCGGCAQHVRATFALAAMLQVDALDLLLAVSE